MVFLFSVNHVFGQLIINDSEFAEPDGQLMRQLSSISPEELTSDSPIGAYEKSLVMDWICFETEQTSTEPTSVRAEL